MGNKRAYAKKVKYENFDQPAVFICQLRAVAVATSYFEMVDIYRASLHVFKKTLPLFIIVTAIRDRQATLDRERRITELFSEPAQICD